MSNIEIIEAAQAIRNQCDGAFSEDGVGFNKIHAEYMHSILDQYEEGVDLSDKQVDLLYKTLKIYKGQLFSHDIVYSELSLDPKKPEKKYEGFDETWKYFKLDFGKFKGKSILHIYKNAPKYLEWLVKSGFDEEVREVAKLALAGKPIPKQVQKKPLFLELEGDNIVITSEMKYKDQIKSLSTRKWDPDKKKWICPVKILKEIIKALPKAETSPKIDLKLAEMTELARMSKKASSNFELEGFGNGKEMYPFQKVGLEFLEATNGTALIADEMGLGKTIQALSYIQLHQDYRPVLIICPSSLKLNWEIEANNWLETEESIEIIKGGKNYPLTAQIVIINYDLVKKWKQTLKDYNFQILIVDESHMIKNSNSQRTKAVASLSKKIPHKILLTGTPILNRPNELWQQLNIIDPVGYNKFVNFAFTYCSPKHNGYGYDFSGASNIEQLAEELKTIMVRRTKDQVLTELPEKQRSLVVLPITNRGEYNKISKEFSKWYKENKNTSTEMEQLIKIEYLKQASARGKLKASIEWIKNFLDTGKKLVVFCTHREIVDKVVEEFKKCTVKIDGGVKIEDRQKAVEEFQNNPKIKLFVGNIEAAGVGITLTAASDVAFLELGWSPGLHEQAEDRCHRIGQKESVNIYYLLAEKTIDKQIADLIEYKRGVIAGITEDKEISDFNFVFNSKV